jgi:hypothetical protein
LVGVRGGRRGWEEDMSLEALEAWADIAYFGLFQQNLFCSGGPNRVYKGRMECCPLI